MRVRPIVSAGAHFASGMGKDTDASLTATPIMYTRAA